LEIKDTYKTIKRASPEVLFKDKNSKFFGYAFPILTEDEVRMYIEDLKNRHHTARHWCYAYQIGTTENTIQYRVNDDGEPNNSAGMPIYGQIQSFDVTNILIVVVRYFGGVKLGIGGLINAYKTTAQMSLENGELVTKTINITYLISFEYKNMNTVMRIIKEKNLKIVEQKLELSCEITISVRLKKSKLVYDLFKNLYEVDIKELVA
jgi:uncharacterized YigZ family protein